SLLRMRRPPQRGVGVVVRPEERRQHVSSIRDLHAWGRWSESPVTRLLEPDDTALHDEHLLQVDRALLCLVVLRILCVACFMREQTKLERRFGRREECGRVNCRVRDDLDGHSLRY